MQDGIIRVFMEKTVRKRKYSHRTKQQRIAVDQDDIPRFSSGNQEHEEEGIQDDPSKLMQAITFGEPGGGEVFGY